MDCTNCGAPLPLKSNVCGFCGTINDVDLRGVAPVRREGPAQSRECPRCAQLLASVEIDAAKQMWVERCDRCLGIFFDPNELEGLLDSTVSAASEADLERIAAIVEREGTAPADTVRYIACPVCKELMNRKNYGARSGVVVDICRDHGVWLDGGELRQLMEWTKAGGQALAEQRRAEEERQRKLKRTFDKAREAQHCATSPIMSRSVPTMRGGDMLGAVRLILRWL